MKKDFPEEDLANWPSVEGFCCRQGFRGEDRAGQGGEGRGKGREGKGKGE